MTGREVVKALKKLGWELDRITGSHHVMKKGSETVIVPVHNNKDLPTGLLMKIKKQTGLK